MIDFKDLPQDKIYFQDDDVVIYCADCRDILPKIPKVDLVLTDPPYGVDYDGGSINEFKREKLAGDSDANLYNEVLPLIYNAMRDGASGYVFYATSCEHEVYPIINKLFSYQQLVWWKRNATFGSPFARYHFDYEPFIYIRKGSPSVWNGGTKERAVWNFKKSDEMLHPTQKPIDIIQKMIFNSSDAGDLVLDSFMGSGTTLFAAKKLGRKCIGIEISEKYCEIARNRLRQSVMKL